MDANTLAKSIVDQAIGEKPIKRPNARAAARGIARKEALTPDQRKEIAHKAAKARWRGVEKAVG
jgi:hypothetical protein